MFRNGYANTLKQKEPLFVYGSVWDEAHEYALELSKEVNSAYIPPFDHPTLWNGHATIIDEAVRQCQKPDLIVLSVGGGGLLCGVVEGLRRNNWGDVPVIAVETEGAASFAASVNAGRLVSLDRINTVATSLGAKQIAARVLKYAAEHTIKSFIKEAMIYLPLIKTKNPSIVFRTRLSQGPFSMWLQTMMSWPELWEKEF